MNRTWIAMAAALATTGLLVESAVRGAVILALAACVTLILRRDSAATRHLVWLVAILAVLVVPIISVVLPHWQVLPAWTGMTAESKAPEPLDGTATSPDQNAGLPTIPPEKLPSLPPAAVIDQPTLTDWTPDPGNTDTPTEPAGSAVVFDGKMPAQSAWNWSRALSLCWAAGCCLLALRLLGSRFVLWCIERRAVPIACPRDNSKQTQDALVEAFRSACRQLDLRKSVRLMVHPDQTIPVVWGVFRLRLLLPAEARIWNADQIRSVLLHELAHIKRRDTTVQLLTQSACALHWFNPLVWFAAWRMHVERERACDDLVLASGVRASAYAGHLVDVATRLSSAPWTQACGLAMARRSSLEVRVRAVLSDTRNRRSVSRAVAVIALLLGAAVAIPVAMLHAADELLEEAASVQPDESEQKPTPAVSEVKPTHEKAQALFQRWKASARLSGMIPGGALQSLHEAASRFVRLNPTDNRAPRISELIKRIDVSRDWTPEDAAKLLDDVTAVYANLPNWAVEQSRFSVSNVIRTGQPLPAELKNAPWGKAQPNGLRVAWLLDPQRKQYHLVTPLKSRILFHNSGKDTVVFRALTWNQSGAHKARDANGASIRITSTMWTTIPQIFVCRLGPGEFYEVMGAGIGLGPNTDIEDWRHTRVGSWILAKAGDDVTFTPSLVSVQGKEFRRPQEGEPRWWLDFIRDRLNRELPLPDDPEERRHSLNRASRDLFGTPPTKREVESFINEKRPNAMKILGFRLARRAGVTPFTGMLQSGETTFRVLPVDPIAAKKPRVAKGPGRYRPGGRAQLVIVRRPRNNRIVNDASVVFDADPDAPAKPYEIKLPDGYGTWAIAWERNSTVLWVAEKKGVRRIDVTDATAVKETTLKKPYRQTVPESVLKVLVETLSFLDEPARPEKPQTPQRDAATLRLEQSLQWGEPVNGLRSAIVIRTERDKADPGERPDLYLALQNVSDSPIRVDDTQAGPERRHMYLKLHGEIMFGLRATEPGLGNRTLQPGEVTFVLMFSPKGRTKEGHTTSSVIAEGVIKDTYQSLVTRMEITKAPEGAWTGRLVSGETNGYAATGQPRPNDPAAQRLLNQWQHRRRLNGRFPGGLVGRLGESLSEFIRLNNSDPAGKAAADRLKVLVPLDASRDWPPVEVVALMNDVSAISTEPLRMARDRAARRTFGTGTPLPARLATAPWGKPHASGLRVAWMLEPGVAGFRTGAPVNSRILVHNAGKEVVVFRTRTRHTLKGHHLLKEDGSRIDAESTPVTATGSLMPYRLRPGQFMEVSAPPIGIGPRTESTELKDSSIGLWIKARKDDVVRFQPGPVLLDAPGQPPEGNADWWLSFIRTHLSQDLPIPADAGDRKRLVYRAGMELLGTSLSAKEIDEFVNDSGPHAIESLAKRLSTRNRTVPFAGSLTSGASTFRVRPPDSSSSELPRIAKNPGRFSLGPNTHLVVSRRQFGRRILNEASIQSRTRTNSGAERVVSEPIRLSDGYATWTAAWHPDADVLWIARRNILSSHEFNDPAQVKHTYLRTTDINKAPASLRSLLLPALKPTGPNPAPPAAAPAR